MLKNNPICRPDYESGILSVVASILNYYGVLTQQKTDATTDLFLAKKYKNVVLFVCDGLGTNVLDDTLSTDGFLRKHVQKSITTIFPSETQ